MKWTLRDGDSGVIETIEADGLAAAKNAARQWISSVADCYDTSGGTVWVDVYVAPASDPDDESRVVVKLDPPEPSCTNDEGHDWQSPHNLVGGVEENPGVRGNGGGVVIDEACIHCGCQKRTDTWAQRPDTGEQGLESVVYQENAYDVSDYLDAR